MLKSKILIFVSLIFLLIIYAGWSDLSNSNIKVTKITLVKDKLEQILTINNVIVEVQKERGLSTIYESNPQEKYHITLVAQQQKVKQVIKKLASMSRSRLINVYYEIHRNIDNNLYKKLEAFKAYTKLVRKLINRSEGLIFNINETKIKNKLILYHDLNRAQELMGQLRAKVGSVLSSNDDISKEVRDDIVAKNVLLSNYFDNVYVNMHLVKHISDDSLFKEECLIKTTSIVDNIIKDSLTQKIEPLEWFKLSTCAVSTIYSTINKNLQQIDNSVIKTINDNNESLKKHQIFWILAGIILPFFIFIYLKRSIALSREQKILASYKNAINSSTIVSSSDKQGLFTYINSSLCEISGYSSTELLRRSDDVLLHPDMPKDFLKNLWSDLSANREWSGIVQNITKDGESFWVDTTISPIYDEKDEVIEYIAIRHDITDIILLNKEIKETQREIIYRLGEAVESRSKESGYHIRRVAYYSKLLAQLSGLNEEECEIIFTASSMHDVGKITIPDSILLKPGSLSDEEWILMKSHSEVGYNILKGSKRPILKAASLIAHEHHERYDGKGYPQGIKGENISLYGRIVAISDVFDALVSDRVYKKAWPLEKILDLFKKEAGQQFDPKLIKYFLENIEQFLEIKNRFQDSYHND